MSVNMQKSTQTMESGANQVQMQADNAQAKYYKKISREQFVHELEARYGGVFAQWIVDRM